jgi:phage-related protein
MADKISWIDANGTEYPLNLDNNFKVLTGMTGRFMPTFSFIEDEIPFQDGTLLRDTKVKARDVDIPLLIKTDNEIVFRQKVRECLRIFNPKTGDGRIRVTAADGSTRELFCRYSGGLEGKEDRSFKGLIWMNLILVFHAFDPYWYDSSSIVQTFKINENPGLFFPILPLRLASSTVFADVTIDNSGDVETWPEWIISGPCDSVVLNNITTGETTNLEVSLQAGETITIDTKPFKKSIVKSDGTNMFYTMTDDSSLWALQEGNNSIQIQMSNATSDSSIQLTYRRRYWGA